MSEWQPIDTAPKDGSFVLVTHNGVVNEAHWDGSDWCGLHCTNAHPTHWMPLPDPPQ